MTDLATWLLEQIDADEAVARATTVHQPYNDWEAVGAGDARDVERSNWAVVEIAMPRRNGPQNKALMEHIATFDPVRVLGECAAKRGIVAEHANINGFEEDPDFAAVCTRCQDHWIHDGMNWPCPTLLLLAQPYVDRAGWDDAWKVEP